MEVLVPFSAADPKSRLSEVLAPDERGSFARAMLVDVVDAVSACGATPHVLSTAPVEVSTPIDVPVTVDSRPLTTAINDAFEAGVPSSGVDPVDSSPTAVVMADLALATPDVLGRFFDATGDVVIAPGRGGGTNALVVRDPAFRVDYHGASYLDHLRIAADIDATVHAFDSHRLASDVDTPADLVEVLVHADGRAAEWLRTAGFGLDRSDGRVGIGR